MIEVWLLLIVCFWIVFMKDDFELLFVIKWFGIDMIYIIFFYEDNGIMIEFV